MPLVGKAGLLSGGVVQQAITYVDDVFASYLYTGNGSSQSINNGIDLANNLGAVWCKSRSNTTGNAISVGGGSFVQTESTALAATGAFAGFNVNGFNVDGNSLTNLANQTYASWTFRRAPRFFDFVTYTGNGAAGRTVPHSLGQAPGMILVKRTSGAVAAWQVYHKALGPNQFLVLNTTAVAAANVNRWNNTNPTDTAFTLGNGAIVNANGSTYAAYLFADDASLDSISKCGSFNTDPSGNAIVDLGWEPQWVMIKSSSGSVSDWSIYDAATGFDEIGNQNVQLLANTAGTETSTTVPRVYSRGFSLVGGVASTTFVYVAIRRPNKPPTSGSSVFAPVATTDTSAATTGFPVDLLLTLSRSGSSLHVAQTRKTSGRYLNTQTTEAENGNSSIWFRSSTGVGPSGPGLLGGGSVAYEALRRAPGFLDVCLFDANIGVYPHNLGVTPELVIEKYRDSTIDDWYVLHVPSGSYGNLNTSDNFSSIGLGFSPTSGVPIEPNAVGNGTGSLAVSYLFASSPGVSKVGTYTGNGAIGRIINCGFSTSARFVMIKAMNSLGDWYVWDTARGIIAANDPHVSLNGPAQAEVANNDSIDPNASGFIVNQRAGTNINTNGVTYLFLAIA